MIKRAVVDRIEDKKKAVILVGKEEKEFIIDVDQLPSSIYEGDILKVHLEEDNIFKIEFDIEEKEKVKNRIDEKMKSLKNNSKSNFKK